MKVSVIIPVYNVEEYLRETLDSVLAGTLQDFELLLVDDGSTDGTPEICRQYAERDERIQVFTKENGGVGSARNYGLDRARGEYIAFIDGDDLVRPDYLEKLVRFADGENLDWAVCGCHRIYPLESGKKRQRDEMFVFYDTVVYRGETARSTAKRAIFSGPTGIDIPSNCMGLFRRSMIEESGIRIPEDIAYGEDRIFNCRIADHLTGFGYLTERMYGIVIRPTSAQRLMMGGDIVDHLVSLVSAVHREIASPEGLWPDEALCFVFNHSLLTFRDHIFPMEDPEDRKRAWEYFDRRIQEEPFALVWSQLKHRHASYRIRRKLFYLALMKRDYEWIDRFWRPLTVRVLDYNL